ncbi:MAG: hypothetical protein IJZ39_04630 [Oscillospiraceae bacterium]|nr:hypothetical protein [Oscillospiraceae bacterium]
MKLFLGLIFVLLDFKITVGTAVIGLLPDFIGCFLIMKGMEERNDPWRHGAFALMLVSLVLFIADLVAKSAGAAVGFWCLEFAAGIGMLFLVHRIVRGKKGPRELFPVLCCIRVLAMLLGWVPLVGTVCAVAGTVVAVCFLAAAYSQVKTE